ncbi:MAG: phosphoribosylanthranilate isomerase [Candidatus Omnitrophica bacterium]|nr:phosphoribosylanthranilate isomerase [Candidatus Omnitrophota bacterium]
MNCARVKIKICGLTNIDDAAKSVYYGATALGFNFYKKSPRYVSPSKVRRIVEALPPLVTPVGIFVNQKERAIREILKFTRIATVQFHGEEDQVFCKRFSDVKVIKAFRVGPGFDPESVKKFKVDAYLFDTFQADQIGGTGKTFSWEVISAVKWDRPVILSGGLNHENVFQAVAAVKPYAVDVASGVEKMPGIKNHRMIQAFCEAVHFLSEKQPGN